MYSIITTHHADLDLDSIVDYIVNTLCNPSAAVHFLDELEGNYEAVAKNPRLFAVSTDPSLAQRGYRKIVVGNYVALYTVEDDTQTITIVRLFYGRQDYANFL